MNYEFPLIYDVEQIREAIAGRPEFAIHDKGDYFVADYAVNFEDSFPPVTDERTAVLRECRGLMFDKEGYLISRAFHKFFNINEREETQANLITGSNDFVSGNFVVLDKMDGSFIRPVRINGVVRLCTKNGITEQALMAEKFVEASPIRDQYHNLFETLTRCDMTGVFEYCSRENQVVLDYAEPTLVLTGIRSNLSGSYCLYAYITDIAQSYGVPVVADIKALWSLPLDEIMSTVKASEFMEGVVLRFNNGHMVKLKSEWYCLRHHAKDSIWLEKNLIETHLSGKLDDIMPMLDDNFRARVEKYIAAVGEGIKASVDRVYQIVHDIKQNCATRKEQAAYVNAGGIAEQFKPVIFAALDEKPVHKFIVDRILKNTSSITRLNDVRPLFKAVWA